MTVATPGPAGFTHPAPLTAVLDCGARGLDTPGPAAAEPTFLAVPPGLGILTPMSAKVTLKDIASAAGVATMTVSRALRDSPKISAARRVEIKALAERMGYRPDPQISRLMSMLRSARPRRTDTVIAVLNSLPQRGGFRDNVHQGAFFRGAETRARALGYKLEEFWTEEPRLTLRRIEHILVSRGIEGLLLLPYGPARVELPLTFTRFAVAAIGRSQTDQPFHRACQNHYRAVQLALRACAGFERVGMVLSEYLDGRAGRRYSSAFLQHLHSARPAHRVPLLERSEWDDDAFLKWFKRHRPQVVLSTSLVIRDRIARLGYLAPRDYGFVNLDLIDPADRCAGVDQNYGLIGAAAVDLLATQLNHHERGLASFPKTVLIDGFWRPGDSLPD
jgi:LacI family transcriptional regulator